MSMSRGCEVIELKPDEWYCVVARDEHDYDFEDSTVYGPANDSDAALEMMWNRESNPGSHHRIPHENVTDRERALLENARKPW